MTFTSVLGVPGARRIAAGRVRARTGSSERRQGVSRPRSPGHRGDASRVAGAAAGQRPGVPPPPPPDAAPPPPPAPARAAPPPLRADAPPADGGRGGGGGPRGG